MPHSRFYYPKSNNQNTFIDALAEGINVKLNSPVVTIEKAGEVWTINGCHEYDIVINTSPLDCLYEKLSGIPACVKEASRKLKYNKVSNVLWKTKPLDNTWSYYPASDIRFHRVINIGTFFTPNKNYAITEIIGDVDYDEFIEEGKKLDFLIEPLAHNISDHAYVLFDQNFQTSKLVITDYLKEIGLYTLGRFGEWDYYNMDICIQKAMDFAESIQKQYGELNAY